MAVVLTSIRRLLTVFAGLIGVAVATILMYDLFVEAPISGSKIAQQTVGIAIAIAFWAAIAIFTRRTRPVMAKRLGEQAATILQITMLSIITLITAFVVLGQLGTSPESLITGAGFASITIGLIISTFVGGLLAGALVFTTHRVRVGDTVIVNNTPGYVTELTPLVTKVRSDTGIITIPNSAISSGTIVITKVQRFEAAAPSRLPYTVGDRVATTYMQGEGVVTQITALRTTILLDNGREITLLNSSIVAGSVGVAKIQATASQPSKTPD